MKLSSGRRSRQQSWGEQLRELTGGRPVENADDLLERVVAARGNKLLLLDDQPYAGHGAPCGIWLTTPGLDAVWVDPSATGIHRAVIICHEVGHMIHGDQASHSMSAEDLLQIIASGFKYLTPEHVRSALTRTTYDEGIERRAEVFATWATSQLEKGKRIPEDVVLARVRESLASRQQYW